MSRLKLLDQAGITTIFDLFHTVDNSHNLLITGETGTGKTTMTNLFAFSAAMQEQFVRVAVIGAEYRETAAHFDGTCLECSPDEPFSLNPFSSVVNWASDRLSANAIFANIARQTLGSGNELLPAVLELLQLAVGEAWSKYTCQADITRVYTALDMFLDTPPKVQRAAEAALKPFLPGELYGGWLSGPALSLTDRPFTVFDLKNLQASNPLFKAVVPALLHAFSTDAALSTEDHPRIFIINDMWQLNIPTGSMTSLLRHGEDRKAAIITVVDSYDDLRHMTVGKVIMANSLHRVFFPSPAMSFNYELLVEAGIPEEALDQVDSPEGRHHHWFYLTSLKKVFSVELPK